MKRYKMQPAPRKSQPKPGRVYFATKIAETPQQTNSISQSDFERKFMGSTAKPAEKVYTGTNMLGVATMHKSNAVPVFNTDAAKDISNMRR